MAVNITMADFRTKSSGKRRSKSIKDYLKVEDKVSRAPASNNIHVISTQRPLKQPTLKYFIKKNKEHVKTPQSQGVPASLFSRGVRRKVTSSPKGGMKLLAGQESPGKENTGYRTLTQPSGLEKDLECPIGDECEGDNVRRQPLSERNPNDHVPSSIRTNARTYTGKRRKLESTPCRDPPAKKPELERSFLHCYKEQFPSSEGSEGTPHSKQSPAVLREQDTRGAETYFTTQEEKTVTSLSDPAGTFSDLATPEASVPSFTSREQDTPGAETYFTTQEEATVASLSDPAGTNTGFSDLDPLEASAPSFTSMATDRGDAVEESPRTSPSEELEYINTDELLAELSYCGKIQI